MDAHLPYWCGVEYSHLMHVTGNTVCHGWYAYTGEQMNAGLSSEYEAINARSQAAGSLENWWLQTAHDEIEKVVPKAIEYGSADLVDIGHTLAKTMKRDLTEQEEAELGIYFYLVGKMSRWTDAVKRGDPVSDDTLHDIGVYVRMAQRVRSHGGWPGVEPTTPQGFVDFDVLAEL